MGDKFSASPLVAAFAHQSERARQTANNRDGDSGEENSQGGEGESGEEVGPDDRVDDVGFGKRKRALQHVAQKKHKKVWHCG